MSAIRRFSFKKGYNQLTVAQSAEVRDTIKSTLNINNNSFYRRLRGEVEPKVTEVEKIETIFSKYGISNIWGE